LIQGDRAATSLHIQKDQVFPDNFYVELMP